MQIIKLLILLVFSFKLYGAEDASSNYLNGFYGTYGVAMAPQDGLTISNYTMVYDAKTDKSISNSSISVDSDVTTYADVLYLYYTFEEKILGAKFMIGANTSVSHAKVKTNIVSDSTSNINQVSDNGIGDIGIIPFSVYYKMDDWYFNIYEYIAMPTANYDVDNKINFGLNRWSFDSVLAVTNLSEETGREYSFAVGIIANSKNKDTDYKTGTEFHIDVMINQYFSDSFGLGMQAYYYKQISGDSGSGTIFGDFKGESYGIGPSLYWAPKTKDDNFYITTTWTHDLKAKNRLKSDLVVLNLVWQFDIF